MARDNREIWAAVNWNNTNAAIARRLKCVESAVRYQRILAGMPPFRTRGGNKFTQPKYREGKTPLSLPPNFQL